MTLAKAQIGDVVTRNRRFTESFVEGEEHTVQRVSDCGRYIWVGGHRHKVPVKYFNLLRRKPSVIAEPPELTDFSTKDVGGGLLKVGVKRDDLELVGKIKPRETPEQYTARTGYRKFNSGDLVISRDGFHEFVVHCISSCGYNFKAQGKLSLGWIKMRDFDLRADCRINRDSVAGLLLQGVELQFLNGGEWFDVNPNRLTVSMIGRLDFRQKPSTIDYYGTALPKPIDVHKTKVKTVYGISMTNHKVYPCALGTARVNKSKGCGLYWEHESQAKQVYDTLMKPFKDVE